MKDLFLFYYNKIKLIDMIYEEFEYKPNKKISTKILLITICFLISTYFLIILTMISLYQQKKFRLFYILYVLLIFPTYIGQIICFIFSIFYLSRLPVKKIGVGFIPLWVWITSIPLYCLSCYIMIGLLLYFLSDMTFSDLSNKKFYQKPFCNLNDIKKSGLFPKNYKTLKQFETLKNLGYKNAKEKKVVFSFLVRNSSYHIKKMRLKIETLGKYFKKYHILIFENDSSDGTRNILKEWEKENKNLTILDCCTLGNCNCKLNWKKATFDGVHSKSRIDKMRMMREYMLNYVKKNFLDWDYSIVMDFDLEGSIFKDGFFTSFSYNNFDVIFGSGLTSFPFLLKNYMLYDSWAFLSEDDEINEINKEDILKDFFHQNKILFKFPIDINLKKTKSGFNGFAIYNISSIKNSSYINNISKSNCEHIDLHLHMIHNGYSNIYFNPCSILFVGQQGEKRIKYFENLFTKN